MGRFIDEVGNRYNRWTVLSTETDKAHFWLCKCDCGTERFVNKYSIKCGNSQSCGCLVKETIGKLWRGKKRSKKTKKLISKNHVDVSGKNNPMYGVSGENSPNWNQNLTDEHRMNKRRIQGYDEWRSAVYEKDNYTCKCCGDDRGGNLVAHHVESYNSNEELRTEVSNGITMCEQCHKNFHHQFGYGDNTRSQLIKFRKKEKQLCLQKVEQMQQ